MKLVDCRLFTGYKPCRPYLTCDNCKIKQPYGHKILIINLDAMGDVLMTTALLPALHRKYNPCTISWLTSENAAPLLFNNPLVHNIFTLGPANILILEQMQFHTILNVDKSMISGSLLNSIKGYQKLGFCVNENGHIAPVNKEAEENFQLGIDDQKKFRENQKTGQQILAETACVEYKRDPYILMLAPDEIETRRKTRIKLGIKPRQTVLGVNTGSSELFTNKCLTVPQHVQLVKKLHKKFPKMKILLLGGREDGKRNTEIKKHCGKLAAQTPTGEGIRKGLVYMDLCDIVISGDSLGMHMAIALKKFVVAWFGLSCAPEIDLYDRGVKIVSNVSCAPCWKPVCDQDKVICRDNMDLDLFVKGVKTYLESGR